MQTLPSPSRHSAPAPTLSRRPRYHAPERRAGGPRVLDPSRLAGHLGRLNRAAVGLCGSPQDADDLVQDVCVRVLSKPRLLSGDDDLGYLMRVLRNTFISGRRTVARRPATAMAPEDLERYESAAAGLEQALEARQLYGRIAELPDHQRDAVVAVDILGLSYKEAAERLGVPTGTVMSRLSRARNALAAA